MDKPSKWPHTSIERFSISLPHENQTPRTIKLHTSLQLRNHTIECPNPQIPSISTSLKTISRCFTDKQCNSAKKTPESPKIKPKLTIKNQGIKQWGNRRRKGTRDRIRLPHDGAKAFSGDGVPSLWLGDGVALVRRASVLSAAAHRRPRSLPLWTKIDESQIFHSFVSW